MTLFPIISQVNDLLFDSKCMIWWHYAFIQSAFEGWQQRNVKIKQAKVTKTILELAFYHFSIAYISTKLGGIRTFWLFNSHVKFHARICTHCWNINESRRGGGYFLCSPCIQCRATLCMYRSTWMLTTLSGYDVRRNGIKKVHKFNVCYVYCTQGVHAVL